MPSHSPDKKQATKIVIFLLIIFLLYTYRYISHPALPNGDGFLGWWGWWDQSKYIQSAKAFSEANLNSPQYWYFPGYALLAAPFYFFMPNHAFFFVNAVCLLISAFCYLRIARYFGVRTVAASLVFAFSTALNPTIFEQFVIPWSSTPTCALIYIIMALFLSRAACSLKFFMIGFLASAVVITRPTDAVSIAPIYIFLAANVLPNHIKQENMDHGNFLKQSTVPLFAGGLTGLLTISSIYYSIYGLNVSEYLLISKDIGFIFSSLPIKLYVLFIDPFSIFGQGTAILSKYPWIFISLIGIIFCLFERSRLSIIAACVFLHILFYSCYADLQPTNIWHFKLIHYLKWTFPLLGLFAWLTVKDFLSGRRSRSIAVVAVSLFCVLSARVDLQPVDPLTAAMEPSNGFRVAFDGMEQIAAVDLPMTGGSVSGLGSWPQSLDADGRNLRRYADFLMIPQNFGLRIFLTRTVHATGIAGILEQSDKLSPTGQSPLGRRYSLGIGWACWLPPYGCSTHDPRQDFSSLNSGQIDFHKGGNSTFYSASGWSGQEDWGTWTDGDEARLTVPFRSAKGSAGHDLELTLETSAFVTDRHPRQGVRLFINGEFTVTAQVPQPIDK